MRCLLLLLFIAGCEFVVCSAWDKVTVPLRGLAPDLKVFEKYYEMFDENKDVTAYIYWPHGITFQVKWVEYKSEGFLQIQGDFVCSFLGRSTRHDYIYFRNSKFSFKKKGEMAFLTTDYGLYYEQPTFFKKEDSYLAIAYHTVEDMKTISADMYSAHATFFNKYPDRKRSVYLASWDYPVKHYLEYTFGVSGLNTLKPDGGLVALMGKIKKNTLAIKNYRIYDGDRIVYDPEADLIVLSEYPAIERVEYHVKDVFGVRMQSQAFLAEVLQGKLRMLSSHHLHARQTALSPDKVIWLEDVTVKLRDVEPRFCDSNDDSCRLGRPEQVQFLFNGHVLVKKVNYKESQGQLKIDDNCPIGIEFENKEMAFHFGNDIDMMICTNDKNYWRSNGEKIYPNNALYIGPKTVIL